MTYAPLWVLWSLLQHFCAAGNFSKRDKQSVTNNTPRMSLAIDRNDGARRQRAMGRNHDTTTKLCFVDDSQQEYDLDDLLRGSAELLGRGNFGTCYKTLMNKTTAVSVKKLRNAKAMNTDEFSSHMEFLGGLKHPNVVPLKAYYCAKQERLLIYKFIPNGSLFSLLHGSRGPDHTPVEWPARLTIAQDVAEGLTYLHQESGKKIPHGNLKSVNILMGENFEFCISDFGLFPLIPENIAAQRMAGYRAPEYYQGKAITYKVDVYSYGILLLELLTGREPAQSICDNGLDLPKWVGSMVREEWTGEVFDLELKAYLYGEQDLVTLLQVAMRCVEPDPEERPEMDEVVELLQGIRGY